LVKPVRREWRDDIGGAADGDDHRAVASLQLIEERFRCLLRELERFARHAPAAVNAEGDGKRKFSEGELLDRLNPIVLVNLKVILPQAGDELSVCIGDGGVHLDELCLRRKRRQRTFLSLLLLRPCSRASTQ